MWFIYGDVGRNTRAQELGFMATRVHSKKTVEINAATHVVMFSHLQAVTDIVEEAASQTR